MRAGARRIENFRLLNTGVPEARPGRTALFLQTGRTDEVRIGNLGTFKFCFGAGDLKIRDSSDAVIATDAGRPWTAATAVNVVWAVVDNDVVMCFPGMRMRVARLAADGSWSFFDYAFRPGNGSSLKAPFYRFPQTSGITMQPSGINVGASITVEFSSDVLVAAHVGVLFRYQQAQLLITGVTDARHANAICVDYLPQSARYNVGNSDGFRIGEIIEGSTTGTRAEIGGIPDGTHLDVIVLNNRATGFGVETVVGPNARTNVVSGAPLTPLATTTWSEQAISAARGWPESCATDVGRLIFCNLPDVSHGIIWSAISDPYDLEVTADANGGIFETIAGRPRIYHVVGGPDEFVFTDRGVKYIPISESNPLKPGSVSFREITSDAASSVRPVSTSEGVLYVDAQRGRVVAIVGTGQTARPYIAQDVSELHADLFKSPIALASSTGGGAMPERYVFALNADGTLAIGKYGTTKEWVGWLPWSGPGACKWVSALDARVLFTSRYLPNDVQRDLVELMEADDYLDAMVPINAVPTQLAPPGGKGPLWWLASSTVALMRGFRFDGYREVDADGFLVPEEGEEFDDPDYVAGLVFNSTLVPFIPHAQPGQSQRQSQRRRKIARATVSVQDSTGFMFNAQRIPPWRQGENQAGQPDLREETYPFRTLGRAIDPTVTITKDVPGPLRLLELGFEVTV